MIIDEKEVLDLLKKNFGSRLDLRLVALVTYSLKNLNHSKKTLFGYALKGRSGQKGFIYRLKGEAVGRNNVLIPLNNLKELEEFFGTWDVRYRLKRFIELKQ